MRRGLVRYGMLLLVVSLLAPGSAAAADPVGKCRQTIVRGAGTLAHARLATLAKCEAAKRSGKLSTLGACRDEPGVVAALAKATAKLVAAVERACGGADKRCGGSDDVGLAAIAWPSTCPDLEGSGCAAPVASCAGVPGCIACLADAAVSRGVALVYAPLALAAPTTQKQIVKCQKALATAATALADARLAANTRCLAASLAGKHGETCPIPGDGKGAAALAKARAKAEGAVCKACGGVNKSCGGGDDLARDLVGYAPACPGVGTCDTRIDDLVGLVACFQCSAAVRADCALAAAAPGIAEYPPACAAVPATPTPTTTPTPTLTASASPTFTASPTPTATPIFCARDVARTATVTLSVATGGPQGSLLGGAIMLLDYDPERVRLDGVGDDPAVRAAVTDLTAGALASKGSPSNRDQDEDLTPDRLRFVLLAQNGVLGALLKVDFGLCVGTTPSLPADYACKLELAVAPDGVTKLPNATCTISVENAGP